MRDGPCAPSSFHQPDGIGRAATACWNRDGISAQPQRKRAIAAAIPIKGNRQNFMGPHPMIYSLPTPVNWTLVLWVQEPQRRQGNRQLGNFDDLVVAAQKPIRLLRFKTCK